MSDPELVELAEALEAAGRDEGADRLREAERELYAIAHPPGLFGRMTENLRRKAAQQWQLVLDELEESRETYQLIRAQVSGERELNEAERDAVRTQLGDLLRVLPASAVTLANYILPVPMTSFLTPWLLEKMGLLPSRWREARALDLLEREHEHLHAVGDLANAGRLAAIIERVEADAEAREEAQRRCALLTHWDANQNGAWDPEEEAAYQEELAALARRAGRLAHSRRWFLQLEGRVFGPVRLSELDGVESDGLLLICLDGRSGWVALHDLTEATRGAEAATTR
ncbi:MAG: hypothetical protein H6741_25025 [Alphaproteobacteria bacterium]|nr:hypothetical protein [Alphaproteobacteria bacterium]MCB9795972.1 hypothetical protein [Alphaproteobacteria bacterium]